MVKFKLINRGKVPPAQRGRPSENHWLSIIGDLPLQKAIKIAVGEREQAYRQRNSLLGCFRSTRRGATFKLHTRLVRNGNGYDLYAWKEEIG